MRPFELAAGDVASGILLVPIFLVFSLVFSSGGFKLSNFEFSGTNTGDLGYVEHRIQRLEQVLNSQAKGSQLISLNLSRIEKILTAQDWVQSYWVKKRLPDTLEIGVIGRERVALLQLESGDLKYLDSKGFAFGDVDWTVANEFVVLSGFGFSSSLKIERALGVIRKVQESEVSRMVHLVGVRLNKEEKLELEVLPVRQGEEGDSSIKIELGQDLDDPSLQSLKNLALVLKYARERKIEISHISLSQDKKIIVKTKSDS